MRQPFFYKEMLMSLIANCKDTKSNTSLPVGAKHVLPEQRRSKPEK
jgi:hypothetical protein